MKATDAVLEAPRTDAPEPRGVCVAIMRDEKPIRLQGDSPGTFVGQLSKAELAWVNFAVDDLHRDGAQVATVFGFNAALVETLLERPSANYEDRDTEFALRLPVVRVQGFQLEVAPLLVLVRSGIVLTMHEFGKVHRMVRLNRYADTFMRKIPADRPMIDKLTVVLTRILNENNERNFDGLRVVQEQGDLIGEALVDMSRDRQTIGRKVYEMKHLIVKYLDVLWSSLDVIHSLRFGDAELVSDDETLLARLGILGDDITRQIQLAEHTTEVLVGGLEVLQTVYNNQLQVLNNRLALVVAWLTILGTLILVPNTMATLLGPVTGYAGAKLVVYVGSMLVITAIATWTAYHYVKRRGISASIE